MWFPEEMTSVSDGESEVEPLTSHSSSTSFDEDEETIKKIPSQLTDLKVKLSENFNKTLLLRVHSYNFANVSTSTKAVMTVNETQELPLFAKINDENLLKALYDSCKPSNFGLKDSYQYDESVRKSRESRDVKSDKLMIFVPEEFSSKYYCEFYKLVVYGPGDFFSAHMDTMREGLSYSMVVTLDTDVQGGLLHLTGIEQKFGPKNIVVFDPAIQHEVEKVTAGYKVSILYNIYEKKEIISLSKMNLNLDSNCITHLFSTIDLKSFGNFNIWISHPLQSQIEKMLSEKGIGYINAVTTKSLIRAVPHHEFMEAIESIDGSQESYSISMIVEQCDHKYDIDFVLCRGDFERQKMYRDNSIGGNSPCTYYRDPTNYDVKFIAGLLITL